MSPSLTRIGLIFACGLLGVMSAVAGTTGAPPPMLRINYNDGSGQDIVCLESMPATIQVLNDDTFLDVTAFPVCPPADIVQINSFTVDNDPNGGANAGTNITFDIVNDQDNCTVGGNPQTCLFFTWDTIIGFNVANPVCSIFQEGTPIMNPNFVTNPGNNAPAEPALTPNYVEDLVAPGLAWPILNPGSVSPGTSIVYRLNCTGNQTSAVTVNFIDGSTPSVTLNNFNITQTSAVQGSTINYSFNVSLINNPTAPSCTLTSPGVIANTTSNGITNGTNSGSAFILSNATVGTATFSLVCRPDGVNPPSGTLNDTVNITMANNGGGTCPTTIPGTTITRDASQTEFAQLYGTTSTVTWPGQWGVSSADQRLFVNTGQYKALRFNTSTALPEERHGRFEWGKSGVGGVPRQATYTISTMCADFTPVNPNCRRFSPANRIPWHFPGATNVEAGSCELQPNTQYYVNIIYDDTADGLGNTTCANTSCNHLINAGGGPPTFPN